MPLGLSSPKSTCNVSVKVVNFAPIYKITRESETQTQVLISYRQRDKYCKLCHTGRDILVVESRRE